VSLASELPVTDSDSGVVSVRDDGQPGLIVTPSYLLIYGDEPKGVGRALPAAKKCTGRPRPMDNRSA